MGALVQLKQILITALPTFILVWILYYYLMVVFYRPLDKALRKRRESTLGLRETAEADLAKAEQKTAEYQEALREAKAELYRLQEQERQKALDQRAEAIRQAQERAMGMVKAARQQMREDVEQAKRSLASDADQIAVSIAQSILKPANQRTPLPVGGSEAS